MLVGLLCLGSCIHGLGVAARAQINSSAFDKHCYQPHIGKPGVIDTIVGPTRTSNLGAGLINIGPRPTAPGGPGRLMMLGLTPDLSVASIIDCGSNFDPHNLSIAQFKAFEPNIIMCFGHFRDPKILDIMTIGDTNGHSSAPRFTMPIPLAILTYLAMAKFVFFMAGFHMKKT